VDAKSPLGDELAALRRRAYGPDADIGDDPGAQARLTELEREHGGRDPDASASPALETTGGEDTGPEDKDEASGAAGGATHESRAGPAVHSRLRRGLPWVLAAAAAVVALIALGLLFVDELTQPRAEAQLVALDEPPRGDVPPTPEPEDLEYLEITDPVFVSHGSYGPLKVWTTTAPHNWRCLAVVFERDLWRFNCTVTDLDTVADVVVNADLLPTDAPGGPIPEWSTIRFVLHDDVVDVYIARNRNPD